MGHIAMKRRSFIAAVGALLAVPRALFGKRKVPFCAADDPYTTLQFEREMRKGMENL